MNSRCRISPCLSLTLPWLVVLAASPTLWAELTFELLKLANGNMADLPGGSAFAEAFGVSADGTFVVGNSSSSGSGVTDPNVVGSPTEGFVWDGNTKTIVGVGDLTGGRFLSTAADVSADGRFVVGSSEIASAIAARRRTMPYRWNRVGDPFNTAGIVALTTFEHLYRFAGASAFAGAGAAAVSDDGAVVVGFVSWNEIVIGGSNVGILGWYWSRNVGFTFLSVPPVMSEATAINSAGTRAVGFFSTNSMPTNAFRQEFVGGIFTGSLQDLGQIGNVQTRPTGVSDDGLKMSGGYVPATGPRGIFRYDEDAQPQYSELRVDGTRAVGMSGDGRVVLDNTGGLYLDGRGPFDLRVILADAEVIDLRLLSSSLFRANAISSSGLVIVGGAVIDDVTQAWRVRLTDCDQSGAPDELEDLAYPGGDVAGVIAAGSERFAGSRETLGYGDMISHYGKPWKPNTNQAPERDTTQPAEFLRAALRLESCEGDFTSSITADRYLTALSFPSAKELHSFEMLLGNEAYADALDPTIGMDGIAPNDLSDQFAFKGVQAIEDLLDEELALLRGRELPGQPADWLNDTIYYPSFTNPDPNAAPEDRFRTVAVYNRLPLNATASNGTAYRSNYSVADNFAAAGKFPQGHGDAHGHFLSAFKAGLEFLKSGPLGWPEAFMPRIVELMANTELGLDTIRRLAEAGAARAQCAAQITELLYRRDYIESPQELRALELYRDSDSARAWSMGDWAHRGAIGAYFDWALVNQLAPTDEAKSVRRDNLLELDELAGAVSLYQERLDAAGAALDPLGLVQNVVPFGIDASGLQPGTGKSHYEQVRDAATRALDNARKAFEVANQADQRLREADKKLEDVAESLEDSVVDLDQRLIAIFGLPSPDDPDDNDLDPSTSNLVESQSHPDLINFFASDEDLAASGFRPRGAPGEVQLALSELRVANLRVEQAGLVLEDVSAQILSQLGRIEFMSGIQAERLKVISTSCDKQEELTKRLQDIERAKAFVSTFISGGKALITGNPNDIAAAIQAGASLAIEQGLGKDDIEIERQRVQCDKELDLQGLENALQLDAEKRQLAALLRKPAQLIIDIAVAAEVVVQSSGRLRKAVANGQLLVKNKQRLVSRTEGQLLDERWKDLSFRVFRNAALKNYRALFDISVRYVVLAARAYAYEFDDRSNGDDVLAGIYRERRLGSQSGINGGLQGVINRLDGAVTVNNFNRPLETLGERSFSFRRNLLGIGADDFPNDDLKFRAFLEASIVERVEDLAEITELAQVSVDRDFGPGIVIPFATEIASRNFFGRGPELPFGNSNFSLTRNAKIRSYAIRLDGVDASLGTDPESGTVFVYLLPAGDSVLRENTNKPRIEDEVITPWAVVDQFLPAPPLSPIAEFSKRTYNAWKSTAQANGNFLNAIKRQRDAEAQIELGQSLEETRFNTNLAGRSAWNTRWLLVIPGSQWTSSSDLAEIRTKILQFIYGSRADPAQHVGITDIRLIIQAYSH